MPEEWKNRAVEDFIRIKLFVFIYSWYGHYFRFNLRRGRGIFLFAMPKGKRTASSGVLDGDVRLSDFAHASLPSAESSRVSKNASNAVAKTIRETRHWWECDEEDFLDDLALPNVENDSDGDDEQVGDEEDEQSAKVEKRDRRKTLGQFTSVGAESTIDSCKYPTDLWFLISEYIRPEDVGRFALICRQSYNVTRSSGFWRQLYKRFYDPKSNSNVPEQFRPWALNRAYGLRTRVIKALFCTYAPFMERARIANGVSLSATAVAKLCRGVCESTWWEQQQDSVSGKTTWRFYFKFRGRRPPRASSSSSSRHHASFSQARRDLLTGRTSLDYLDDTWANLEDDCCILKVACQQYTQIPTVLGWRLSELNLSLCSDMRSHRLRLIFSESGSVKTAASSSSSKNSGGGAKEVAMLDSVQTVSMFDWWHPHYPLAVL